MDKIARINQVLEKYFNQHPGSGRIPAKDFMPYFIKEGIFVKDQSNGLPIRAFLRNLDEKRQLNKIPYVIADRKAANTNWYFAPVGSKSTSLETPTPLPGNTRKIEQVKRVEVVTLPSLKNRSQSDESYIIDLCDEVLGEDSLRQHRFPFLLGDPGSRGVGSPLPVDAWYPDLNLVVEYHERQHNEPVKLFDRRVTVSGVTRGEQRKMYDERRVTVLAQNKIDLVILAVDEFQHNGSKRLLRNREHDLLVIRRKLQRFIK